MPRTWVYQDDKQVKKRGAAKASWYVGWFDPEGKKRAKSCGPGAEGKNAAFKMSKKIGAELVTGTYKSNDRKTWTEFRAEYEEKILPGLAVRSQEEVKYALDHFQRLIKPVRMGSIKTATVDDFTAKRRKERGKKPGETISPATVNKDLRHLRAALHKAHRWGYLPALPYFDLEKEPGKLVRYMVPEHFASIYTACDGAELPKGQPYAPADWWRGLLVMAYMTGWRIGDLQGLRREDLDLAEGVAISRAVNNKSKRDEKVTLHSVAIEHLKKLASFSPRVLPWPHDKKALYAEFAAIQGRAGVKLVCGKTHEHTPACHRYGFHDLRRAFATMNAAKLTPDALQALMRHKSYSTTQRYIAIARQMDEAVASLHVPEILKGTGEPS
jgi:integrase